MTIFYSTSSGTVIQLYSQALGYFSVAFYDSHSHYSIAADPSQDSDPLS
jgi:hypothetical protein